MNEYEPLVPGRIWVMQRRHTCEDVALQLLTHRMDQLRQSAGLHPDSLGTHKGKRKIVREAYAWAEAFGEVTDEIRGQYGTD